MKVAINGFGRIGRNFFRSAIKSGADIDVVAVNDLTDAKTLAYLLQHDTVHGKFGGSVTVTDDGLDVDGDSFKVFAERDPEGLPWGELGVDVVIESTGVFRTHATASKYLTAGAGHVIVSAPVGDPDYTIVLGVNDGGLDPANHKIISNASCTTNCVAPMVKVLHEHFGIVQGMFTTVHAYTNDQKILDLPHSDARRGRAAAANIIPTSTGAAVAVGKVLPELSGRFEAKALRVPVVDGSITDLVVTVEKDVSVEAVNQAFAAAGSGAYAGIIRYSTDPIVSSDIIGDPASVVFDSEFTMVSSNMVKVFGWYDNEWGYSSRLVDLVGRLG
jgi:glyceraldehyde 3-phosphate dehydrogenase (phosphorylating)